MKELLALPTIRNSIDAEAPLVSELICDIVQSRRKFIGHLARYDGEKATFTLILADAIERQGLSVADVADICETAPTTVSRWAKGAAPSALLRKVVVDRLKVAVDARVDAFERELPEGFCYLK